MKILVRHFFTGLFDLGFLSETGVSSLPRTIATTAGVLFAVGAMAARIFMYRYRFVNNASTALPYEQAVLTDHVFLIAVPMWLVAFVTVLAGPSLFPDETDFRVLMSMPVSQRLIFAAKLVALILFVAVFMVIGQAASLPVFTLTAIGPWAQYPFPLFLVVFLIAGVLGSVFAALAVTAVHATLLLLVPRQYLLPASAAAGSVMLFLLIMAVPLVGTVPSFAANFSSGSLWLYLFPPAWFVGLERWLLGEMRFTELAAAGLGMIALAGLVAGGAYLFLYRHFDRVILRPASDGGGADAASAPMHQRAYRRPALTAVRVFTLLTLRRSVLHQGVLVAIAALGAAMVVTSMLGVDLEAALNGADNDWYDLVATVIWAPLVLIFVTVLAVRASLLVPIEERANWVFRMTEQPRTRADQIEGAGWVMRLLGVALPVVLVLPVQWLILGWEAVGTSAMTLFVGAMLVELILFNWRRLPFTCSYLAGKGFVPVVLLKGVVAFIAFTTIGSGLAALTRFATPSVEFSTYFVLGSLVFLLRALRRRQVIVEPLEFEDVLPTEANPLRLSAD